MPALLIKNGRVIDPASGRDGLADVWIEDGLIRGVGANLAAAGADVFDATGLIVAPGFIDMHVHLREPGFEHAETIESGSRAAAAGGFTSICPMPNTAPVNDSATVTSYIIEKARRHALVNVFPIGAITKGSQGEDLAEIGSMRQAGAVAISDDGRPVMNARVMRRAMEFARSFRIPVIDHCEDLHLSAGGDMHEGLESVRLGLRGIPGCSEEVMVARDILLAEVTGARYHVAHISSRHSVEMVAFAKARGLAVTAEATPHHLALTDGDMPPYDSNYKMKPPLRSGRDVNAVVEGVVQGAIDAIATDHAPHPGSEKMQEFEQCPFGIIGLETALGVVLKRLVHPGRIGLPRLVELFTTGPARILGIDRGTLAPGAAADLTIFSTDRAWTYDINKSFSKSRNSPYHGASFRGGPVATVVAGEVVWQTGDAFLSLEGLIRFAQMPSLQQLSTSSEVVLETSASERTDAVEGLVAMGSHSAVKTRERLRVFLCHSSADKPTIRTLYGRLRADGFEPWQDEEDLIAGQEWEAEIKKAVRNSHVVAVCLSQSSVTKEGFVQNEITTALKEAETKPEGTIFVIPIRLDECDVPVMIRRWQWVELFKDNGYEKLRRALQVRESAIKALSRLDKPDTRRT